MTVLFYTLGCKVNQYDTQTLRELFLQEGFTPAAKGETPDVVVINTCTVTGESDRKGRQAIGRFARTFPKAVIAVTGCMPQARPEKAEALTAAHVVIGNALNRELPRLVKEYLHTGRRIVRVEDHAVHKEADALCSHSFEGRTRAFVKIEDGCNRFCSYCLVPYARGRVRSKPLETVKKELAALAANGYREIVLAGINLTAYGSDLPDGVNLCDAVEAAAALPGVERVRLGSMEPDQLSSAMLDRLAACKKLCPQFHLCLQSAADGVLHRMHRQYDAAFYRGLITDLRRAFPGCAVTTDILCGFPEETEEEFAATLAFADEIGFARIHAFAYSPREGTPAAAMTQVPPEIKKQRMAALTAAADRAARNFALTHVGQTVPVLFEQKQQGVYEGYTADYLPVRVSADVDLRGKILPVLLEKAENDRCIGRPVKIV